MHKITKIKKLALYPWCFVKVSVRKILMYEQLKELDKEEKLILSGVSALTQH